MGHIPGSDQKEIALQRLYAEMNYKESKQGLIKRILSYFKSKH